MIEIFICPKIGCPSHRVEIDDDWGTFQIVDAPCYPVFFWRKGFLKLGLRRRER